MQNQSNLYITDGFVTIPKYIANIPRSAKVSDQEAMFDLYFLATWKPYTFIKFGKKISLIQWQLSQSMRFLEKRWQRSEKWVQRFLMSMQERWALRYESSRLGTLITLGSNSAGTKEGMGIEKKEACNFSTDNEWNHIFSGDGMGWILNKRGHEGGIIRKELIKERIYSNALYDEINEKIPVLDILHKCGYETFKKSNTERGIKENGQKTSWHSVSIKKNIVFDLTTGKCRPCGGPVALIKRLYGTTSGKEIIEIAEREYGFHSREFHSNGQQHYPIETSRPAPVNSWPLNNPWQAKEWELLKSVAPTVRQIEYTAGRWVLIAALRGGVLWFKGGRLALAIRNSSTGDVVGIQTRESDNISENRYKIIPWGTSHGYFYDFPSEMETDRATPGKMLVVEGFMDYLSVRQFTPYVIGVTSASSDCHDFHEFGRLGCAFAMIPHQDTPGEWLFEKLNQKLPVERVRLDEYDRASTDDIKDMNDYLVKYGRDEFESLLRRVWILQES